ncbi:DgyrCDS10484 [Dimorphilus gyrociliatus]|uniref:HECT-type E3 ubiquitin transferase n=1 Tax=Dimorphilus gyrociliatus TaxID=2664684 RepID=A0A7I8W0F4_9ANNE|nr:DgyrCDS10484 [Dimorphilus gyrociliatus]
MRSILTICVIVTSIWFRLRYARDNEIRQELDEWLREVKMTKYHFIFTRYCKSLPLCLRDFEMNSLEAYYNLTDEEKRRVFENVMTKRDSVILKHFIKTRNYLLISSKARRNLSSYEFNDQLFIDFLFNDYSTSNVKSKVIFGFTNPVVGETLSFTIELLKGNGFAYHLQEHDKISIDIILGDIVISPTQKIHGNTIEVLFSVHRSGSYKISVMINNKHISSSPYYCSFNPKSINMGKSNLLMNNNITQVCTVNSLWTIQIQPRDEYGNPCFDDQENSAYQIELKNLNGRTENLSFRVMRKDKLVELTSRPKISGPFWVKISYKSDVFANGEFWLLVLNHVESKRVEKDTLKEHNVYYDGKITKIGDVDLIKPKKIYISLSHKQLSIKKTKLLLFPIKLFTFRINSSTRIIPGSNEIVIRDTNESSVTIKSENANYIAAAFTHFYLLNTGGSNTFEEKKCFFHHSLRQQYSKYSHTGIKISVNRFNIVNSSLKALKNFSKGDWCKKLEVSFKGEAGIDCGGLQREWFELLCNHIFNPEYSVYFNRLEPENTQTLIHPTDQKPLSIYEFAGRLVGKSLYEASLGPTYTLYVPISFTRSFLAMILGLQVSVSHMEHDCPELYQTKIKYIANNYISDLDLTFSEEVNSTTYDLIANGRNKSVNESNKREYIKLLTYFKLERFVKSQVEEFIKGINYLVPDELLSMFDENELEILICGSSDYSVADLKENHTLNGSSAEFRQTVAWFWTILSAFTKSEMARLLQFTTGCSKLPSGGFSNLVPKFQICASNSFAVLPTAHTCFNQLCLPGYESLQQMKHCLTVAINEGCQGFGLA